MPFSWAASYDHPSDWLDASELNISASAGCWCAPCYDEIGAWTRNSKGLSQTIILSAALFRESSYNHPSDWLGAQGSPKAAQEQPKGSPGAALGAAQGKPNGSPRASSLLHPVKHSETNKKSKKQHFCTTWTQDETSTRMICSFHPGMQRSHPKGQGDCRIFILISTSCLLFFFL